MNSLDNGMNSINSGLIEIDCTFQVDGAGDVASYSGLDVSSITHLGAGSYKINLSNSFNAFLAGSVQMVAPVSGASGIAFTELSNSPASTLSSYTTPYITVTTYALSVALGVLSQLPANPANGSSVSVTLLLRRS